MPIRSGKLSFDSDRARRRHRRRDPNAGGGQNRHDRCSSGCVVSARLRVVVADDERPARSFLVSLLRSFEDVAVVGEAASGKDAVALIEKERPDLALLDWQMPELDGI